MDAASFIQTHRAKLTCNIYAFVVASQRQIKSLMMGDLT